MSIRRIVHVEPLAEPTEPGEPVLVGVPVHPQPPRPHAGQFPRWFFWLLIGVGIFIVCGIAFVGILFVTGSRTIYTHCPNCGETIRLDEHYRKGHYRNEYIGCPNCHWPMTAGELLHRVGR